MPSAGPFPAQQREPDMRTLIALIIAAVLMTACASSARPPAGISNLDLRDDPRPPACRQGRVLVCSVTGGFIKHYDECRCRVTRR